MRITAQQAKRQCQKMPSRLDLICWKIHNRIINTTPTTKCFFFKFEMSPKAIEWLEKNSYEVTLTMDDSGYWVSWEHVEVLTQP